MKKFVQFSGIDPFIDDPGASNPIYLKPEIISHIENYTGMWPIQAFGPDGRLVQTGKHKQIVNGAAIVFYNGQSRFVLESVKEVLDKVDPEFD